MADLHPAPIEVGVRGLGRPWWRRWRPVVALVAWSLFVWVGRVRNVLSDDALPVDGRNIRLALALSFVVPAALLGVVTARSAVADARRRSQTESPMATSLAVGLAGWTVAVWIVRGLDIVLDGQHDLGFRFVHSALAVVSIVAAGWVLRSWRPVRNRVTIA